MINICAYSITVFDQVSLCKKTWLTVTAMYLTDSGPPSCFKNFNTYCPVLQPVEAQSLSDTELTHVS